MSKNDRKKDDHDLRVVGAINEPTIAKPPKKRYLGSKDGPLDEITRVEYLAQMPGRYRNTFRRAYNRKSRQAAIRAKCLDCTNWQIVEIKECPIVDCPLYEYRGKIKVAKEPEK